MHNDPAGKDVLSTFMPVGLSKQQTRITGLRKYAKI
jgi:hypothetical protein